MQLVILNNILFLNFLKNFLNKNGELKSRVRDSEIQDTFNVSFAARVNFALSTCMALPRHNTFSAMTKHIEAHSALLRSLPVVLVQCGFT